MKKGTWGTTRRNFLKAAGFTTASLSLSGPGGLSEESPSASDPGRAVGKIAPTPPLDPSSSIQFPRSFTGAQLSRLSFPVGGIGTGGIEIGGRGDLRLWQIFNRPESGDELRFVFPAIHVASDGAKPFTSVLERRLLPPYDRWDYFNGERGVGVPEMPRLAEAVFSTSFPIASIRFADPACPVEVSLTAFSPFSPVDADDSGLPVAILEYTVRNTSIKQAKVAIAMSIENPCAGQRLNALRTLEGGNSPSGVFMNNPDLPVTAPKSGSFALLALPEKNATLELLKAWSDPGGDYAITSFWEAFTKNGSIPKPGAGLGKKTKAVGTASMRTTIASGDSARFRFVLAWHFPNRTPEGIGWGTAKGTEKVNLGNFYATRFGDAWSVAEYAITHLAELERKTFAFQRTMREATLPGVVKDAAASNLSTLVSNTCFRMADGSFHGFEGCSSSGGQGPSCSHVWNYEVATSYVFPVLSRSMRETSFGYPTQQSGQMDFRYKLPLGHAHFAADELDHQAAADGQLGQVVRLYLDWRICGDTGWMLKQWPAAKRVLVFAWIKGGWDANRDGVMEGAQHNTYDVQFLGPSGMMQSWYLAALRASAAMAKAANDAEFALECERIERAGSAWTDEHLFQGEFYIQQIRRAALSDIDPRTMSERLNPMDPYFQLGGACHVDQIVGQYMAGMAGLGDLLSVDNMKTALRSVRRYNPRLGPHALTGTHRMYAINDEAALNICAYVKQEDMPVNPVAYSCENWCGLEYSVAAAMIQYGMVEEAVEHVTDVRARHDGERRNPMDELEWGHHYARSMSSWALIPLLSGFRHDAVLDELVIQPRLPWKHGFRSPWTANTGWGEVQFGDGTMQLSVIAGVLSLSSLSLPPDCDGQRIMFDGETEPAAPSHSPIDGLRLRLAKRITVTPQRPLRVIYRISP